MGLPVVGKKYYCLHAITVAWEDKEKKLFGTLKARLHSACPLCYPEEMSHLTETKVFGQ